MAGSSSSSSIVVEGLSEFRAALRRAEGAVPRTLTKALKNAAIPILKEAAVRSPVRSGRMAASYRARVAGASGVITSTAPYGAGGEWGIHRKWSGFARYGARGNRFAGAAITARAEETMQLIYDGLRDVVTIEGWART